VAGGAGREHHGDAGQQPATAHRYEQRVERWRVGQELEPAGALAGHDERVVVGRDEHELLLGSQLVGLRPSFSQTLAVQDDPSAERFGARHLHVRCEAGHHDGGRNAEPARVVRHALRVVAGRCGHHTPAPLVGCELEQAPERAAVLEARRELQVLELQPDLRTRDARQRARGQRGCVDHLPGDAGGRRLHVGEGDRGERVHSRRR
jgi:hypothetical protein